MFFVKNGKNKKIVGLNANGLEIKLRAQRAITFVILTIRCIMAANTDNLVQKIGIQILFKNTHFLALIQ